MQGVSVGLISVRDSLPEVLQESHQEVHTTPSLYFLVLQLVNGGLDVPYSTLEVFQGLLESFSFCASGAS
jgi:hypothetical protein